MLGKLLSAAPSKPSPSALSLGADGSQWLETEVLIQLKPNKRRKLGREIV